MDIRMRVLYIVLLFIVITVLNIKLLRSYQKRITFIHPGWILVIVNCLYGLFVPIAYILMGDNIAKVYVGVANHFDSSNFIKIVWIYTIISFSFFYSQVLITLGNKISVKNSNLYRNLNLISNPKFINRRTIKFITNSLLLIGIYLIYLRFSVAGGFISVISESRRDLAAELAISGVFTRYEYFLQPYFIISLLYIVNLDKTMRARIRREKLIFSFLLLMYFIYLFLMGIRLNIIVLSLGLFYVLYTSSLVAFNKQQAKIFISRFWTNHKKVIMVVSVITFLVFGWYTYHRTYIRSALIGETIVYNSVPGISLLFPSEFSTGYIPGLIILNNDFNSLGSPYWQKFIPDRVLSVVGVPPSSTVAKALAWSLHGVGRAAVFTITLPVDIYTATNSYLMIFIIGSILYFSFWFLFLRISKKGFWGKCVLAIVFLNLFYVVRVEAANWFPRVWQGGLVLVIVWVIYSALSRIRHRMSSRPLYK